LPLSTVKVVPDGIWRTSDSVNVDEYGNKGLLSSHVFVLDVQLPPMSPQIGKFRVAVAACVGIAENASISPRVTKMSGKASFFKNEAHSISGIAEFRRRNPSGFKRSPK
jgi:hypothetical protein